MATERGSSSKPARPRSQGGKSDSRTTRSGSDERSRPGGKRAQAPAGRRPVGDSYPEERVSQLPPPEPELWIDEGVVGSPAGRSRSRSTRTGARSSPEGKAAGNRRPGADARRDSRGGTRPNPPRDSKNTEGRRKATSNVSVDGRGLVDLVGERRAERLAGRVASAAEAFEASHYTEARQILTPIAKEAPEFSEARELLGLTLYRLGRWKEAARELEAFSKLCGNTTEQHPVLADCRRALKQYREVDRLWTELKEASPSGELVTEGRIVAAGALADQGELGAAIRLLAQGFKFPKRPREHHLRRAYALADLYERSGDVPQARALFGRLAHVDGSYLDAADRAIGLG